MTLHQITSTNLSNSLVFYRALFNQMPQVITPSFIQFHLPEFDLRITESENSLQSDEVIKLEVSNSTELELIGSRMKRYRPMAFYNRRLTYENSINLIDPDGAKWVIDIQEKPMQLFDAQVALN